ncbi:MAG TPA: flagellar hook basal-body protein [Bryobacteraceae bacterium]|nr:flagellar hook basal-body protein [Bryobacteraceae bacterium]
MDPLLVSAASGMTTRMESLDMLANNIANTGTAGFKADRDFYNLYERQLPVIEKQWTDFSQGTLIPTGNSLDLGLSGKGFFALNSPSGIVYTRNGQFQISKANLLETAEGYTLRNARANGMPIAADPTQPVQIDKNGVVTQQGQEIGQIEIAGIGNPSQTLAKLGNSYFAAINASYKPAQASGTEVRQGALEQSNVPAADAAVRLVGVMRQFEMLQKAMLAGADMDKQAIEQVAKVD